MAALRVISGYRVAHFAAVLVIVLALSMPTQAAGADPSQAPGATERPPSCADRFPAEGPAGVDLRLGCIVSEVVGLYIPGQAAPPPALSSYAIVVGTLITGAIVLVWLVARFVGNRAGRRLAPVMPAEWWACATCKSVNGGDVEHCYSCGSVRPDGPALVTDERPITTQSFGNTRKRG